MEGVHGNGEEEVPRPRMWWEEGGQLGIPLNRLLRIRQQRTDYDNPEYWRRLRRERREREAMQRQEEKREVSVNHVVEAVVAEDELVLEMKQALKAIIEEQAVGRGIDARNDEDVNDAGDGGNALEEEVTGKMEADADTEDEELAGTPEGQNEPIGSDDGDGTENALGSEETLKTVEVTEDVTGGDAGREEEASLDEVEGGAVIFDQKELNGLVEGERDALEHGTFKGEKEGTGQDKNEVNIRCQSQATDDDKIVSQTDNQNELPAPPRIKRRDAIIIPDHVSVLPGSPPKYNCNLCQKSFKSKQALKVHSFCDQSQSNPKPFQCRICDKVFVHKSQYEDHLRQHQNLCPYKCIFCDKGFYQQGHFDRHLRAHTREKPFMCRECPGCFGGSQGLKVHVDSVHKAKGSKAFVCAQCPKRFDTQDYLNRHVSKVHPSNRSFECVECGKAFGSKAYRDRHFRSVHVDPVERPHKCNLCSSSFCWPKDLRRHLSSHTDERPLKCRICEQGFKRKDHLEAHIRKLHGVSKENVADQVVIVAVTSNGKEREEVMSMSDSMNISNE